MEQSQQILMLIKEITVSFSAYSITNLTPAWILLTKLPMTPSSALIVMTLSQTVSCALTTISDPSPSLIPLREKDQNVTFVATLRLTISMDKLGLL